MPQSAAADCWKPPRLWVDVSGGQAPAVRHTSGGCAGSRGQATRRTRESTRQAGVCRRHRASHVCVHVRHAARTEQLGSCSAFFSRFCAPRGARTRDPETKSRPLPAPRWVPLPCAPPEGRVTNATVVVSGGKKGDTLPYLRKSESRAETKKNQTKTTKRGVIQPDINSF